MNSRAPSFSSSHCRTKLTCISAGHETAGHTLTWVLAYLSLDQQLQDDLYAEINEVCGDNLPSELSRVNYAGPLHSTRADPNRPG
jgi:cytochrome P450